MILSMIVAIDQNNGIGKGDDQLAYISADLKRFKALTTGHTILMGRKTFEALPKGALPNRRNIIITRQNDYVAPGADVVHSVSEALDICKNDKRIFVIGGGEIYKIFLPETQELYLTVIEHCFKEATVFFPEINMDDWTVTNEEGPFIDERSQLQYFYKNFQRIK